MNSISIQGPLIYGSTLDSSNETSIINSNYTIVSSLTDGVATLTEDLLLVLLILQQ